MATVSPMSPDERHVNISKNQGFKVIDLGNSVPLVVASTKSRGINPVSVVPVYGVTRTTGSPIRARDTSDKRRRSSSLKTIEEGRALDGDDGQGGIRYDGFGDDDDEDEKWISPT